MSNLTDLKILPMTFDDLEDILNIEKLSFPSPWTRSQFEQEIKNPLSNKFTAKLIQNETHTTLSSPNASIPDLNISGTDIKPDSRLSLPPQAVSGGHAGMTAFLYFCKSL